MTKPLILFLIIFGLLGCHNKATHTVAGFEGNPMPTFDLLLMDSAQILNTNNIPRGKPIVLFYFNPDCPYCKAQTNDIIEDIKELQKIQFCFVSDYPFSKVKKYYNQFNLTKYSNITVGQDYNAYFPNYIKALGAPYSAIYGPDKRLKQLFMGKTDIQDIKHKALD